MSKVFEKWKFLSLFLALFIIFGICTSVKANEFETLEPAMNFTGVQTTTTAPTSGATSVVDADGNVWTAYVDGSGDIYINKLLAASGTKAFASDIKVLDQTANLSNPKIVVNPNGGVVVVALDTTAHKAYMQVIAANGTKSLPISATTQDAKIGQVLTTDGSTAYAQADTLYDIATDGTNLFFATVKNSATTKIDGGHFSLTDGSPLYAPKTMITGGAAFTSVKAKIVNGRGVAVGTEGTAKTLNANSLSSTGWLGSTTSTACVLLTGAAAPTKVTLLPDGADGLVVVCDDGTDVLTVRLRASEIATMGNTPTVAAVKTPANAKLLGACFVEGGNQDYIAYALNKGSNLYFEKRKIVNIGTAFPSAYNTELTQPTTTFNATAGKIVSLGASNFCIVAQTAGNEPHAFFIGEKGTAGTDLQPYITSDTRVRYVTNGIDGATVSGAIIKGLANTNGQVTLTDVLGPTMYASAFTNVAHYDLQFSGNLVAVTSPFEVTSAGGTVSVKDKIENIGDETSPATTVSYYLTDKTAMGVTGGQYYLLGTRDVVALGAGKSETTITTTELTIPPSNVHGITGGTYFIIGCVNKEAVAEEAKGGNTLKTNDSNALSLTIKMPKLTFVANTMSATPNSDLTPGATVSVTDTVINEGLGSAPASVVKYYLVEGDRTGITKPNDITINGGIYLGQRDVPELDSMAVSTATTDLTLPSSWKLVGRTLNIVAVKDADNAVIEESTYENKVWYVANRDYVNIGMALPNLGGLSDAANNNQDSTITVIGTNYRAGDTVSFSYTIKNDELFKYNSGANTINTGNIAVTNVPVKFYFGDAGYGLTITKNGVATANAAITTAVKGGNINTIKAQCVEVYSTTITDNILPGESKTYNASFTMPDTGGNTLYMVIDPDNVIQEADERDNVVKATGFIDTSAADLMPTTLAASSTHVNVGDTVKVSFAIKNAGGQDAPPTTAAVYLTTSGVIDENAINLGMTVIPAIKKGNTDASVSGADSMSVTIPSVDDGYYKLVVKVDNDDQVMELSETNNTKAITITVGEVETYPTLDLRIDPIAGTPGVAFHFTDNVYDANGAAHISANTIQTGTEAVDLYVKCTYPDGQSAWLYFDADGLVRFHDEPAPEWSNVTFDETTDYALIHPAWWFDNSKKAEWNLPIGTYTWEITVVKAGGSIDVPEDIVQTDSATLTLE